MRKYLKEELSMGNDQVENDPRKPKNLSKQFKS